ncbi:hypothetical protein CSUI_009162 [Cystoisospora suis]|uniref:Transmembrane protein n=1 Tax=Cystoisospora suis TaxID=483139 RepID=A0A2C6JJ30_9APIC|nr:hypothetical protein CSUI_009162 [Cystoisospora suis]
MNSLTLSPILFIFSLFFSLSCFRDSSLPTSFVITYLLTRTICKVRVFLPFLSLPSTLAFLLSSFLFIFFSLVSYPSSEECPYTRTVFGQSFASSLSFCLPSCSTPSCRFSSSASGEHGVSSIFFYFSLSLSLSSCIAFAQPSLVVRLSPLDFYLC